MTNADRRDVVAPREHLRAVARTIRLRSESLRAEAALLTAAALERARRRDTDDRSRPAVSRTGAAPDAAQEDRLGGGRPNPGLEGRPTAAAPSDQRS
jgi:hypothetical protein